MHPIDETLIRVPLRCQNRDDAIGELLDLLVDQGLIHDRDEVYRQILERESKRSTVIGYGAAIPHARSEHVDTTVCAFGRADTRGINFSSEGEREQDAQLLFLMVSPQNDARTHMRTLAKIARLIKDEERRDSLKAATKPQEVLELLGDLT
jgi:mannitol/fructose-specific phosphotransferase system IIA component (Ntr-type)